jgi:hypothetical protein
LSNPGTKQTPLSHLPAYLRFSTSLDRIHPETKPALTRLFSAAKVLNYMIFAPE